MEPCNFFRNTSRQGLPGAYLMKSVIHDWDDDQARIILANCRESNSRGRLFCSSPSGTWGGGKCPVERQIH